MNVDPTDTWLAIGAGISIGCLGLCILANFIRNCRRSQMKQSRSDNDLANMLEEGEST